MLPGRALLQQLWLLQLWPLPHRDAGKRDDVFRYRENRACGILSPVWCRCSDVPLPSSPAQRPGLSLNQTEVEEVWAGLWVETRCLSADFLFLFLPVWGRWERYWYWSCWTVPLDQLI